MTEAARGPIFVVGVGRSGTTLLRYMLCSHPRIYVPPDANFIPRLFRRRPTEPLRREEAVAIVRRLTAYKTFWRDWREEPLDPEVFVDGVRSLTPAALMDGIYSRYARQYGAQRWGDKSTTYTSWIELIVRMFPDCQIVHIVRDARDVAVSSVEAFSGVRYLYMDPYYAARMWRDRVAAGIAAGRRLPPERYLEVRYEELTADPQKILRQICGFLLETFDPAMLSPNVEAAKHYHSFGIYAQTNEQVTTLRTGRWHDDLAPADARIVQRVAGQQLVALGYPLEDLGRTGASERVRTGAFKAKFAVLDQGRTILRTIGVFDAGRTLRRVITRRPWTRQIPRRPDRTTLPRPARVRITATQARRSRASSAVALAALIVIAAAALSVPDLGRGDTLEGVQNYLGLTRNHVIGPVTYAQIPPVGGDHNAEWLDCGAYDRPVPNENAVHDLEHGAVWITYRPDLPPDQVRALDVLAKQSFVLVSPFPGLEAPVVATSWGHQIRLGGASDPRLANFIVAFRLGPETPELGEPCTGGLSSSGAISLS